MAPEQLEGKPADARTDLWALGAILYEMVTGTRAFAGASQARLISAIMSAEPAALTMVKPLTPSAVDRLVRQCLAKAPDDRPDTAHDVARELRWITDESHAGGRRRLRTAGHIGGRRRTRRFASRGSPQPCWPHWPGDWLWHSGGDGQKSPAVGQRTHGRSC